MFWSDYRSLCNVDGEVNSFSTLLELRSTGRVCKRRKPWNERSYSLADFPCPRSVNESPICIKQLHSKWKKTNKSPCGALNCITHTHTRSWIAHMQTMAVEEEQHCQNSSSCWQSESLRRFPSKRWCQGGSLLNMRVESLRQEILIGMPVKHCQWPFFKSIGCSAEWHWC